MKFPFTITIPDTEKNRASLFGMGIPTQFFDAILSPNKVRVERKFNTEYLIIPKDDHRWSVNSNLVEDNMKPRNLNELVSHD